MDETPRTAVPDSTITGNNVLDAAINDIMAGAEMDDFYHVVLDGIPSSVFVVETDARIVVTNTAACTMLKKNNEEILHQCPGDALCCLNAHEAKEEGGCGHHVNCSHCVIRNSLTQSLRGRKIVRQHTTMTLVNPTGKTEAKFLVTTSPLEYAGRHYALLVLENLNELGEREAERAELGF